MEDPADFTAVPTPDLHALHVQVVALRLGFAAVLLILALVVLALVRRGALAPSDLLWPSRG